MQDNKSVVKKTIATSVVSATDWVKIRNDLLFIEIMTRLAKEKDCRLIVSGGYAVDGNLGEITRPHGDIDIQIFGQISGDLLVKDLMENVKDSDSLFLNIEVVDKGRQEYYHQFLLLGNGFRSDVYYVQVSGDPFGGEKCVIKKDGSHAEKQVYDTVRVVLEGTVFEAVNPTSELVDKIYKRKVRGDVPREVHDQDMENLKKITDSKVVVEELGRMK